MEQKRDINRLDYLYDELQTPLLICVLFFIFQLPAVNKKLFRYIPTLFIKEGYFVYWWIYVQNLPIWWCILWIM